MDSPRRSNQQLNLVIISKGGGANVMEIYKVHGIN
jgi:hypothetical protein